MGRNRERVRCERLVRGAHFEVNPVVVRVDAAFSSSLRRCAFTRLVYGSVPFCLARGPVADEVDNPRQLTLTGSGTCAVFKHLVLEREHDLT